MRYVLIGLLLMLAWLQYELWFAPNGVWRSHELSKTMAEQRAVNEKAQKRNDGLFHEIDALKHNPKAMAQRARDNFGMVKKGETYYQIIDTHPVQKKPAHSA